MQQRKAQVIRSFIFFIGLFALSFGIVLTIKANLGVAPWDVLHIGLYNKFGLTIGSWSILVGISILSISSILLKKFPPIGSFLNMFLVGIFIDVFMLIPVLTTPAAFLGKLMMLVIGIGTLGLGMGIYISARLGAGPRDSLMIAIVQLTGWKVQYVRLTMEISVLIAGWLLGGPVHIGTIINSLIIGHIVSYTLPLCNQITERLVKQSAIININDDKIVS